MSSTKKPQTPLRTPLNLTSKRTPTTSSSLASDGLPLTPFSTRGLSSAFTTPLSQYDKPTRSGADVSSNWRARTRGQDSSSDSQLERAPVLRSPAFLSNDRRLPGAPNLPAPESHSNSSRAISKSLMSLLGHSSPSTALIPQPLGAPFSPDSSANATKSKPRLFNTAFAEALSVIPDYNEDSDSISSPEDAPNNRHFFIRMDHASRTTAPTPSSSLTKPANASQGSPISSSNASCSGCGSRLPTISYLKPCLHPICHQCFTGILNIVGEKGLQCPACHSSITDFSRLSLDDVQQACSDPRPQRLRFKDVIASSSASNPLLAPSLKSNNTQVIRIDNLPWDVTPTMLSSFLGVAAEKTHVLLERATGKTLSHCFVELSATDARTIMRVCQNKMIGEGRRTRAVSVTLSSQEELMKEVFPSWRGVFAGTQPSLYGVVDSRQISEALRYGLLSFKELDHLLALVQNPESPFLKVPSLPFYALMSIMQKIPAPSPSMSAFFSTSTRDRLFAVVQAALHLLVIRVAQEDWSMELLEDFGGAAVECVGFTDVQRRLLAVTAQTSPDFALSSQAPSPIDIPATPAREYLDDLHPQPPTPRNSKANSLNKVHVITPSGVSTKTSPESFFEELGSDVGVDAEVIRMVYERLFSLH